MLNAIGSYPSVFALGHKAILDILSGWVVIEEKIDGSQFSMFKDENGILHCRSKGQTVFTEKPEGMFLKAVETAKSLELKKGWVYRCEYLRVPKHNTLCYARIPKNHLILFDVMVSPENYLGPICKLAEAERIGLECVPLLKNGKIGGMKEIAEFLNIESCLGGCKVEGVVLKNYSLITEEKKIAIAKFVSAEFKEKHAVEWKSSNPSRHDVVERLVKALATEARYRKGVQHLTEAGMATQSLKDIGPLISEVGDDVQKEETDFIKDQLYDYFWPQIRRQVVSGVPDFYKKHLAEQVLS